MHYARLGSVSSGTMRAEDLIPAFADTLEALLRVQPRNVPRRTHRKLIHEARALHDYDSEDAGDIVNELMDALNEYAPPYSCFGAHQGDGADYGFWPSIDSLEEAVHDGDVLKIADLADIPAGYAGEVMLVNDHGNVTLLLATRGRLTELWSVV